MHLLSVDRVTASVEGRTLFADASFGLTSNDRVGVVGPNGSGKTTLLRILVGDREPDGGQVVRRSGLRIGWLPQLPELPDGQALDVVLGGDPLAEPHEGERLLAQVGVDPTLPVRRSSGGQQRRVALARTLLAPSDLLVLDEPTNHLDVDAIDWLEEELGRRNGGLVLVTHDRYVLDRVTTRMLDLDPPAPGRPAEVVWHEGSYASLLEARAQRAAHRERSAERARNLLVKEAAWLRRRPKARGTKPKARVDQVAELAEAAAGDPDARPLELGTGRTRLGDAVYELEGVTLTRGEHTVLDRVDLGIGPGERVGVVGPNGSGKSTLLHLLAGRLTPDAGTISVGRTVRAALYEQEAQAPSAAATALDTIVEVAPYVPLASGETLSASKLAERFGFEPALQRTPVELLSGGERRRLALLHVLVAAPNVLLLDEPTNDLDLDTLVALEDHLDGFGGTLVVASHDRYVLDRLTDRTLAVEHGQVTEFLDWASYREHHRSRPPAAATTGRQREPGSGTEGDDGSAHDNRQRQAERRHARALGQRLEKLTQRREQLQAEMADAATQPQRLIELQQALTEIDRELAEVEDRWLELTVD